MKRILCLTFAFFVFHNIGLAQHAEDSVKNVINSMFTAMRNADSNSLKSVFSDAVILQTIATSKEGDQIVRTQKIESFIQSISSLSVNDADEQIKFETIKIDGPMAIVWTPYKFYYKGNFSHCGVNVFQLVRLKEGWKINYLIDTRRKQYCE